MREEELKISGDLILKNIEEQIKHENELILQNKRYKETLDKIKRIIREVQDDEFYINLTKKEKALYEIKELLEEIN